MHSSCLACRTFGLLIPVLFLTFAVADEVHAQGPIPGGNARDGIKKTSQIVGKWSYRSFVSNPDLNAEPNSLLFGSGTLDLAVRDPDDLIGTLGGEGWQLDLSGKVTSGEPTKIRFTGKGIIGGEEWIYDYLGFAVPAWPNGVDQRPAIVGTIVRTKDHSTPGGIARAGVVAQWIAVKQDPTTLSPLSDLGVGREIRVEAETLLKELESQWAAAVGTNDPEQIGKFFTDDFLFVGAGGVLQNRQEHLDDFRSGKLKIDSVRIDDFKANLYDGFAVVNTLASVKGKLGERDITGSYRFMDTFRLQANQWFAVARQQTKVAVSGSTSPVEFSIDSENYKFVVDGVNNPLLKVQQGSLVRISLTSRQGSHDWVLANSQGTVIARTSRVSAGQPAVTVEFTASDVGTFAYYCGVGSHRTQGMEGAFMVESSSDNNESRVKSLSGIEEARPTYSEYSARKLLRSNLAREESIFELQQQNVLESDKNLAAPERLSLSRLASVPFLNPIEKDAEDGLVELEVRYGNNVIGSQSVKLRSYNGLLVGPTLRVKAGRSLRVSLKNSLPPEPAGGSHLSNGHHDWNTTNLHTHGLHVKPQANPDSEIPASVESDNVLIEIPPGSTPQEYSFEIPADHPAGTFWYHAHKHGSTSAQVSSGMAGALIVTRDDSQLNLDSIPEVAAASRDGREKIMVFQQIPYLIWNLGGDVTEGRIELKGPDGNSAVGRMFGPNRWGPSQRYTTINGQQLPVIEFVPGEIQRWRMIDSGFRESLSLQIIKDPDDRGGGPDHIEFCEIAVDGLPANGSTKTSSIEMFPGYRSDVLVKAPEVPGTYHLIDAHRQTGTLLDETESLKFIAKVVVKDVAPISMSLPTDAQIRSQRLPSLPDPAETTPVQHAYYGLSGGFVIGRVDPGVNGAVVGKSFEMNPSEPRILPLGAVQKWSIGTRNDFNFVQEAPPPPPRGPAHPFHIHVNPFEIISIKDPQGFEQLPAGERIWRDTISMPPGYTIEFLTRYDDFVGSFVNHCHILDHEDNGMMEKVTIEDSSIPHPVTASTVSKLLEQSQTIESNKPSVTFFVKGSFCPHCMEQLTKMASSLAKSDAKVMVVTASSEEDVKAFPKVPYRIVADPELKLFKQHGAFDGEAKHATIVKDRTGKEVLREVGDEPFMDAKAVVEALGEVSTARDDAVATFRETTVSRIVDARVYNSQRWPRNLASVVKGQPTLLVFYRNWEEGQLQLEALEQHLTQLQALRMSIIAVGAINSETLKAQLEAHTAVAQLPIAFFADAELKSFRANGCLQEDRPLNGTFLMDSDGVVLWSEISEIPFSDGEEILRQATVKLAAVEIEIRGPSGTDDYLTWAASQARIRLRSPGSLTGPQTVILKNRDPSTASSFPKRGLVRFAGTLHSGETATQRELTLVLPLDGSWVNFHVAGDPQFPSSSDKDCHIDVVDADSGQLLTAQPLMVRVRKDARGLSAEEWTEFLEAISTLHKIRKEYESFVEIHDLAAKQKNHPDPGVRYTDQAHGNPGFLPWHRVYLLQFERKLQESHPHVALPFWRQDQPANFFDLTHMGTNRHVSGSGFQVQTRFDDTNPLNLWYIEYDDKQFLLRTDRDHTLLPTLPPELGGGPLQSESEVIATPGYRLFARGSEQNPHNQGHNWVGEWMANCRTSPSDPLFWVFHCEYDRLWAKWQYTRNRFVAIGDDPAAIASYEPTTAYQPTSTIPLGHHRQDKMWPWDGTQGNSATGEMRSRRPPKAYGPFPASGIPGVWPDRTTAQPTPGDAIDYLGMNTGKQEWGFCYEEIPFGAETSFGPDLLAERTTDQHNLALSVITDARGPDELRATAVNQLDVASLNSANIEKLLSIASHEKSSLRLRSQILSALSRIAPDEAAQVDLKTAGDAEADTSVRRAAISRLGLGMNFGSVSPESAGAISRTLERLFDDPEPTVAEAALQASIHHASEHTAGAVGWLMQRLSSKDRLPLPLPNAVSIIAAHGTKEQRSQLRSFLDSNDANIREAALAGLASDVDSSKQRAEIALMDPVDTVREAALLSLLPDPLTAVETAEKILRDPKSPLELKALAVAMLREAIDRAPQQVNVPQLKSLLELLERELREANDNTPLQRSIQHHLPRLKEVLATLTRS